jgi:hypothetical protein
MGSYTTNYQLLKAGDGSVAQPIDDYVDVQSQLDRNLSLIDDFGNRATAYRYYDNTTSDHFPVVGNHSGDKVYSNYNHSAMLWNSATNSWVETNAKAPVWTDVTPNAGYQSEDATRDNNLGYYRDRNNNTIFLRGIIIKTGLAVWSQGVLYSVFPVGTFPAPGVNLTYYTIGGLSTGRAAQFYQIQLNTTGSLLISKYGGNAQTAGSAENYVSLEGINYGIS